MMEKLPTSFDSAQPSGMVWKNGAVLTAQQLQQLDNAKINTSRIGVANGVAPLDANAMMSAPVSGDVSGATANAAGDTVSSIADKVNKTWMQASALGSGLAQFLVDNLGVDVTDADTPATFSSRIANAVLKLAQISPFNQSWAAATGGYRKYAIVSDSSGNFWVSTADQNVTVPGDSGAKWQNLFDGYATNTALQAEASSRANADTNLQNQVNNRVLKTGDTMTGDLSLNSAALNIHNNSIYLINPSGEDVQIYTDISGSGLSSNDLVFRTGKASNPTYTSIGSDGRIYSSAKGDVAFESDISNLQNQINNRALKSDLPLPEGMHCQIFTVDIPNPVPADGWLANIPTGWSIHSYVTGCDTGANVYVVSAKVENSTQARIWAKFPTNGALGAGGTATISSFGYF